MSANPSEPMSAEKRAILAARVAQLKALQASLAQAENTTSAAAPSQPAQSFAHQHGQPSAQHVQPVVAQYGYGYDDEDEYADYTGSGEYGNHFNGGDYNDYGDYDDYEDPNGALDEAREAFFDEMERLHFNQPQSHSQPPSHHVDPVHKHASAASAREQRVLGDFEVMRLAKMGDARSCVDFAEATGVDLRTFVDNADRNVLHYAADSGNVALVKALLTEKHVPFQADALGLTPLDVAILAHTDSDPDSPNELIDTLVAEAAKVSRLSVDQKRLRTVDELCRTFAPKPPGFVMSKSAPPQTATTSRRFFWTADCSAASDAEVQEHIRTVTAPAAAESGLAEPADVVTLVARLYDTHAAPEARDAWLLPVEETRVRGVWTDAMRLSTHGATSEPATVDGLVLSWLTGGHVQGFTSAALKNYAAKQLACVSALAVAPAQRGLGVAAGLMCAAHKSLKEAGAEAAAFVAPVLLPSPPAMVSMVKWLRHALQPARIFQDQAYAEGVFPEFFREDQSLRAAAVLKGYVSQTLFEERQTAMMGWSPVIADSDEQVDNLLTFLQTQTGAASGVELAYVPDDAASLRRTLLGEGLLPYAYVKDNVTTDFVVFRRRELRAAETRNTAVILDLVYATFTSHKAVEKSMHVLLLAQHLHHADVLYVPTMFGFTDSDLVKAHFEEDPRQRQFLYICNPQSTPVASPVPATPASKVALPVFVL